MKLVLDTNVIISALVKKGIIREFILKNILFEFITPAYTLGEINKHKSEICNKGDITEQEFYQLLDLLFRYIMIINPSIYSANISEAAGIIGNIDKEDIPFIAVALTFNCPVWTDDKHFKMQDRVKILTTKDILNLKK